MFASNRGHDSIAIFKINQTDGSVSKIETVKTKALWPRNFSLFGDYMLIAGQLSDNIVVYRIDADISRCHLIDTGIEVKVPSPVVIKVLPNF